MAITKKDGSPYKLRGPNPLMKKQEDWDKKKLRLINMGWDEEVVEDVCNPIKKFDSDYNVVNITDELGLTPNAQANATKPVSGKSFIEEIQEVQKEAPVIAEPKPVVEVPVVKPEAPVLEVDPKLHRIIKERGVEYYCAPAIGQKVHMDNLYGNTYETTQYGDKYVFDAVVVDQTDLQLQFWCIREVTIKSIVYRKVREGGQRWWRIKDVEPKTGGYLVIAQTSDTNPDFS